MIVGRCALMCGNCVESEVSPLRFKSNGFGLETFCPVSLFLFPFTHLSSEHFWETQRSQRKKTRIKEEEEERECECPSGSKRGSERCQKCFCVSFCRSLPSPRAAVWKSQGYSNKSRKAVATSSSRRRFLFKSLTAILSTNDMEVCLLLLCIILTNPV